MAVKKYDIDVDFEKLPLPEVVFDSKWDIKDEKGNPAVAAYYKAGNWTMGALPEEDGSIEQAYESALAWLAWYKFIKENQSEIKKIVKPSSKKK
jgi:hypothetical protein